LNIWLSLRSIIGIGAVALLVAAVSSFATSDLLWTVIAGLAGFVFGAATTVFGFSRMSAGPRER
jgi:hypothetical protein